MLNCILLHLPFNHGLHTTIYLWTATMIVDSSHYLILHLMQGAFSVAAKAKVPVVPITLVGTGALMPNREESKLFSGRAKIIVHPAIPPGNADEMMVQARRVIASPLPSWAVA